MLCTYDVPRLARLGTRGSSSGRGICTFSRNFSSTSKIAARSLRFLSLSSVY